MGEASSKTIGILGAGFATRVTVPALRAEGWDVVALFSRRAERAEEIAGLVDIAHHTDDAAAVLARDDIAAVHIATPTSTHRDMAMAAFEAGKHVLCEKPLAMNAAEAIEIRDAGAAHSGTTMVNFEFRHLPERTLISRLVAGGAIGRPIYVTADLHFRRPFADQPLDWRSRVEMGGGALNEQGSHYFDAFCGWLGEPTAVSAQLATYEPERVDGTADADDFFAAHLEFTDGAMANLTMAWGSRIPGVGDLRVTGTEGTLSFRSPAGVFARGEVRLSTPLGVEPDASVPTGIHEGEPIPIPDDIEQLGGPAIVAASRLLARDFARGIDEGTSPSPNLDDGLRVQRILDGARASAQRGEVVTLRT